MDDDLRRAFVFPETRRFAAKESELFNTTLYRQARLTDRVPVVEMRELLLTQQGCTSKTNYRFTWPAFVRMCGMLGRGLGLLVSDLTGHNVLRAGQTLANNSVADAIDVFNSVVRLRFDLVAGSEFLLNREERVIEGVFSAQHKLLTNHSACAQFYRVAESCSQEVSFFSATLCGRRLLAWFREASPRLKFTDATGEALPAFFGFCLANAEAANGAISVDPVVFTRYGVARLPAGTWRTGGVTATPRKKTELNHSGKYFRSHCEALFRDVLSVHPDVPALSAGFAGLAAAALVPNPIALTDARLNVAADRLRTYTGLQVTDARQTLGRALNCLEPVPDDGTGGYPSERLAEATWLHMFAALCKMARELPGRRRVRLEKFAGRLLLGAPCRLFD